MKRIILFLALLITLSVSAFSAQIEMHVDNNGQDLFGVLTVPDGGQGKYPLVILSHPLGGTADFFIDYAADLADLGYASYRFDFRGGGEASRSDGVTTDMSPLTEADDLRAVIETAKGWDFVDWDHVYLMGGSQGGLVTAIVAPEYQGMIDGIIVMYPAFTAIDMVHENYTSLDEVPDSQWFNWITLGKKYWEDLWDYDAYAVAAEYKGPALILQGDADVVVDISYADRLSQLYVNDKYYVIPGAGHGFQGDDYKLSMDYIASFLAEQA